MVLKRQAALRRFLLGLSLVAAGAVGTLVLVRLTDSAGSGREAGGGMMTRPEWQGMMREMMGGMLPPGIAPEELPDPEAEGARLLVRYCTGCHGLPSPAGHTAREWPGVVDRMLARVRMMSRMGPMMRRMRGDIDVPGARQRRTLLSYLEANALRPADAAALPEAGSRGAALFQEACSQCHELPDPGLHTSGEWPAVVERMRDRMREWGRRVISDEERDAIVGYLGRHAGRPGGRRSPEGPR